LISRESVSYWIEYLPTSLPLRMLPPRTSIPPLPLGHRGFRGAAETAAAKSRTKAVTRIVIDSGFGERAKIGLEMLVKMD
jgi:hypothetical protein